jgi:SAM-dependent methyltransferase
MDGGITKHWKELIFMLPSSKHFKRLIFGPLRFGSGIIRSIYQPSRFGIKRGYIHRHSTIPHDDRGYEDTFQKEVYEKAAMLMADNGWQSILDMGCGSGYKLMKYLGQYETTGIDYEPVIHQAKTHYPKRKWKNVNDFNSGEFEADLILCADVIEHVEDPDAFLHSILTLKNWKCLMISTPERNERRGFYHFGPPPNPSHWREWSAKELYHYISRFHPVFSQELIHKTQGTQLIICMNDK